MYTPPTTSVISVVMFEAVCQCSWSSGVVSDAHLAEQIADLHDAFAHPEGVGQCPAKITVENMANLPLDCRLAPGHELPHIDTETNAQWVP